MKKYELIAVLKGFRRSRICYTGDFATCHNEIGFICQRGFVPPSSSVAFPIHLVKRFEIREARRNV